MDERLDPYSGKSYEYTRETPAEVLKQILRNEEVVEEIVRSRSWRVLGERCLEGGAGRPAGDRFEEEWNAWYGKSKR